jgi:GT2 family glycosyltransferase
VVTSDAEVEITVAVPVKDRRDQMMRCLDALLAQDHPSYEILVLDNGSSDGTAEACADRARDAGVPMRVEVIPGTVGHVRNRAADFARGTFLAFTDSDCVPAPAWLSSGVAAFRDSPDVGVVCGCTLPEVEVEQGWAATLEVREPTNRFESCNVFFRTDAFRASAGFDETVGHYWEDTAAGFAMRRDGWKAGFAPDAVVYHDVTYPGFWWHVKRAQKNAHLGPVLRNYPELREEFLYRRYFMRKRNAQFLAFLVGAALARFDRRSLVLTIPYVVNCVPGKRRPAAKEVAQAVIYDGSVLVGLLRGGIASRRLVF